MEKKKNMTNSQIPGTPYLGVLPDQETHQVTGWWRQEDDGKVLVATTRDLAAFEFADDRVCDACGRPTGSTHRILCDECGYEAVREKMRHQPDDYVPAPGAMVYSHRWGKYYQDMEEFDEDAEDMRLEGGDVDDPLLCWTRPCPPPSYDQWDEAVHDDDDGDWWDDDCQDALDKLNAVMAKAAPQAWEPTYHPVLREGIDAQPRQSAAT